MSTPHIMIAGAGIGGLALGLTLQQLGVPCTVFESVRKLKPLGVGINVQPNAIRELYNLGVTEADMDTVGLPAREWALGICRLEQIFVRGVLYHPTYEVRQAGGI